MVSQGVNPLVETAVAVMEIAEADGIIDGVSVEDEADVIIDVIQDVDVIADVILVEAEVGVIIVEIQDLDVIQGVTDKTEVMTKSVQRNAIEKPAESAPDMHTIGGRNQYDLGDIREEIETIEVKT